MTNATNAAVVMVKVDESSSFNEAYWTRSDWKESGIDLRIKTAAGSEAPTKAHGLNSGDQYHNKGYGNVPLMDLELICEAQANKSNGPTPFDWTSNAHYYLFTNPKDHDYGVKHLYIALTHGGWGSAEWLVLQHMSVIRDEIAANIASMPEPVRYMMLDTLMRTARNNYRQGEYDTRNEWAEAYHEGRIQKKRKNGYVTVSIESEWETERRLEKKAARAAKAA